MLVLCKNSTPLVAHGYVVFASLQMAQYLEDFKKFYVGKHSGRKLQWQHSLGQCVLKSSFPQGEKEIQVSLFQTLVLLLFNSVDVLTYLDIREQTGLGGEEIR